MSEFDGLRLSPYYLNSRRLEALTGADIPIVAQTSLNQNSGERAEGMRLASRLANDLLKSGRIPNLAREVVRSDAEGERVVGAVWGVFTFRGLGNALDRERTGKSPQPATFSGTVPLGDQEYELSGQLLTQHFFSDSTVQVLSGRKRMLVAGQFEFTGSTVEVQPFVIGDMISDVGGVLAMSWSQTVRLYPQAIDAFAKMNDVSAPTSAELTLLQKMPEDDVKHAFAAIIGEPFVPKDWGGEKSDLSTSRLSVDGKPLSAAFIFKGPSVRGPMHPANMGKRGDQLPRAYDEPVDVIVVQHCDQIANSVVRLAEALAFDVRNPRRYCIIDGADTARILKAYGRLKAAT
jgi:hypothetical protein